MKIILKKDPQTQWLEKYWEIKFTVESIVNEINYYYARYDEKLNKFFVERYNERKLILKNVNENEDEELQHLQ